MNCVRQHLRFQIEKHEENKLAKWIVNFEEMFYRHKCGFGSTKVCTSNRTGEDRKNRRQTSLLCKLLLTPSPVRIDTGQATKRTNVIAHDSKICHQHVSLTSGLFAVAVSGKALAPPLNQKIHKGMSEVDLGVYM